MNVSQKTFLVQHTLYINFTAGDLIKEMGSSCRHVTRTH